MLRVSSKWKTITFDVMQVYKGAAVRRVAVQDRGAYGFMSHLMRAIIDDFTSRGVTIKDIEASVRARGIGCYAGKLSALACPGYPVKYQSIGFFEAVASAAGRELMDYIVVRSASDLDLVPLPYGVMRDENGEFFNVVEREKKRVDAVRAKLKAEGKDMRFTKGL